MKVLNVCFYVTGSSSLLSQNEEFENKYQEIYKWFVSFLAEKPKSHLSFAFSGPLLSWIDREHPEFTQVLSKLTSRKQTEILGGGYYNPVFPLLFPQDRTGQIDLMTSELRRCIGKRPRGMAVFNSIWDNNLVSCIQSCGMEYVLLDSSLIPKEKQFYLKMYKEKPLSADIDASNIDKDKDKKEEAKEEDNLDDQFRSVNSEFILPDGNKIQLGDEKILAPEILFNSKLNFSELPSFHEIVFNSIIKADINIKNKLYNTVVLSGGNTQFKGMEEKIIYKQEKAVSFGTVFL